MRAPEAPNEVARGVLSTREVAERLGVSKQRIHQLRTRPKDPLPHQWIGPDGRKTLGYSANEVDEWLERRAGSMGSR